jgi:hypothetical protein
METRQDENNINGNRAKGNSISRRKQFPIEFSGDTIGQ